MWSIQLQWKKDSSGADVSVDMQAAEAYWKANAGAEYRGNSCDTKCTLWFENEPSQGEKDACQDYWDDLGCDANNSITATGVSCTLSSDCYFTLKVGDEVEYNSEKRNVASITDQKTFDLDSAFTSDPTAQGCCLKSADMASYCSQDDIISATDSVRSSLQSKIENGDSYDTFTAAEKKLAAGMSPSKAELGL